MPNSEMLLQIIHFNKDNDYQKNNQTLITVGELSNIQSHLYLLLNRRFSKPEYGLTLSATAPSRDDSGAFLLPLPNPNQSLISKKKHLFNHFKHNTL